ncbi:hypothetical protein RND81_09G075300 [Saponaria officinalis]|uniref:Retrotransposon Copia-like N-terminal domain-containing protein n=1 Tax=Saponaria officinalis TaxID=3572 RepID=A0AAW1IJY5_SAPOF
MPPSPSSSSSDRSSSSGHHPRSFDLYDQYDDPLFLSTADQPHLHLTSYLFDGSNFLDWRRDVLMALTAKNKEGFLAGECSESSISPKKRSQWARCDLMVLHWVLNSISKPIRDNVLYAKSSKEPWSDLSESYESVATHILSMDPLPPINKALGLLQKIERQKLIIDDQSVSVVDASADASTRNDSGHYSTPSVKRPRLDKEDKTMRECSHCLNKGHTIDECFKLKICTFFNNKYNTPFFRES